MVNPDRTRANQTGLLTDCIHAQLLTYHILPLVLQLAPLLEREEEYHGIMDQYLLGRVFRSFAADKPPQDIVIFAGAWHNLRYIKVFHRLGMHLVHSERSVSKNKHKQCLSLRHFPLPLFSKMDSRELNTGL